MDMKNDNDKILTMINRLHRLLISLLPGIFLIGYNVGTGSVTAMAKAGASFGYDLLWAILLSCVITYYLMSLCSRFTIVTGLTLIEGCKKHIHPVFTVVVLVALSSIILSALIGILGIIADVQQVWMSRLLSIEISVSACAGITAFAILILLLTGNSSVFEKTLAVLVAIMGIAFVTTAIIEFPGWHALLGGLIPSIPENVESGDNHPLVVVSGVVGTTVSVFVLIIRTGIVKEKKWTVDDLKLEKRDAAFSAALMFIVSAAILITAASTLHVQGIRLNNIVEMIPMLEPVFGYFSLSIFVIGILAAGLSSHLPNVLVIPWLIDDYFGVKRNTRSVRNRVILVCLTLFSFVGVSIGFKPIFLMLLSQAAISIILPLVLGAIIYLTTRESIMGNLKNTNTDRLILFLISLFALYVSSRGVVGFVTDIAKL